MQNNLRFYRRLQNLTQKQLAFLVGTSKTHISDIENGIYLPSLNFAYKLSFALCVNVYDLFNPDINETCIKKFYTKGVNK